MTHHSKPFPAHALEQTALSLICAYPIHPSILWECHEEYTYIQLDPHTCVQTTIRIRRVDKLFTMKIGDALEIKISEGEYNKRVLTAKSQMNIRSL